MIKTLKELRDMDISEGCPTIEGLPDTSDHTKYYPFILKVLSQEYIKVEDIVSLIELAYDKYVVPDELNLNGVKTEHLIIGHRYVILIAIILSIIIGLLIKWWPYGNKNKS